MTHLTRSTTEFMLFGKDPEHLLKWKYVVTFELF